MSHEIAERPGIVARVLSSVEAAIARVTAAKQAEAERAKRTEAEQWQEYRQILCRSDSSPKKGDEHRLEELVCSLKLEPAAVRKDAALVAKLRTAIADATEVENRGAASSAAAVKVSDALKRHKEELDSLRRDASQARSAADHSWKAVILLGKSLSEQAEWFEPGCLEFPSNVPKPAAPTPPPHVRTCSKVEIYRHGRGACQGEEPVVGADGSYVQNGKGEYLLSDGTWFR